MLRSLLPATSVEDGSRAGAGLGLGLGLGPGPGGGGGPRPGAAQTWCC